MNQYAPVGGSLLVARFVGDLPWYVVLVLAAVAATAEFFRPKRRNKLQAATGAVLALSCAVDGVGSRLALCSVLLVSVAFGGPQSGVWRGLAPFLSLVAMGTLALSPNALSPNAPVEYDIVCLLLSLDFMAAGANVVWTALAAGVSVLQPSADVYVFAVLVLPCMCGWNYRQLGRPLNDEGLYVLACVGALALCAATYLPFLYLVLVTHFVARWLPLARKLWLTLGACDALCALGAGKGQVCEAK